MARIQVLPLPTLKVGDTERTPFILIIDQVNGDTEDWDPRLLESLRQQTGAAFIIAHEATLDAPGNLELTDEQHHALLAHLTEPLRWASDQSYPDPQPHLIPGPTTLTTPPRTHP